MKMKKELCALLAAAVLASSTAAYAGEALKKTAAAESFTEADQEPAAEQEDLSAAQFTTETIQLLNGNRAAVHSCDGRVYFVEGSCSAGPVKNMEDAERVLSSLTRQPLLCVLPDVCGYNSFRRSRQDYYGRRRKNAGADLQHGDGTAGG